MICIRAEFLQMILFISVYIFLQFSSLRHAELTSPYPQYKSIQVQDDSVNVDNHKMCEPTFNPKYSECQMTTEIAFCGMTECLKVKPRKSNITLESSQVSPSRSNLTLDGTIILNDTFLLRMKLKANPQVILFIINQSCILHTYTIFSMNGSDSEEELQFIQHSPPDSFVIGIAVGPLLNEGKFLLNFGFMLEAHKMLQNSRSALIFVGSKDHRGHTVHKFSKLRSNYKIQNKNKIATTPSYGYIQHLKLSKILNFGVPFAYNLEKKTYSEVLMYHSPQQYSPGGLWKPSLCTAKDRLAIIVPFRHRENHLWIFLYNIITFLKKQQAEFQIFIIEQTEPVLFNRATLLNIGYLEASKLHNFSCYIFHDVDLIPEDLTNIYSCHPSKARHLVGSRNVSEYVEAYWRSSGQYKYFGGAIAMTSEQIQTINGFSNELYGWGGEDDEMFARVKLKNIDILEYPVEISQYVGIPHKPDEGNPHNMSLLVKTYQFHAKEKMKNDGLNNMNYTVISKKDELIYTHLLVDIPGPTDHEEYRKRLLKYEAYVKRLHWNIPSRKNKN